jgi:class 3 adenylate cyclase/tetratricopeptide (TPR) repeat protein
VAGREERKVVTVLFCDLVGSTAQAERMDPEDVRALLSAYHNRVRSELERYGGTVEKFIGDAVMALFGAPTAHEDDPERAVRAALAVRDWAREEGGLQVRIGITTGEALVSLAARSEAGEGMASGDVVNTAARLQSSAEVNAILVDEPTYRATGAVIEYEPRPAIEAKGKVDPIDVWQPGQARARFGVDVRQHGAAPLVGRERELEALVGAFERAREEGSCQLATLIGVPGIGKSRLVYELFRRVEEDEELIFWRQGRSLPYGEGISFWALGEMVKSQAGILEGDGPEPSSEKLAAAVGELLPDAEAPWVETHLRSLVGIGTNGRGEQREESFAAWRRFVEGLAEQRPTVLVFEDLHWADEGLLDFVDHLVDWVSSVPLLVIATARPELLDRRPGWAGGKLNATTVALRPLGSEDCARLIAALLERSVLPAAQQHALLERAGGNPLYAEQFARLFVERGSAEDLPLPETVQGIVAARLDGLSPAEKAALQDASVHGKVFWSGALEGDPREVRELLHALERKDFVRRERRSSVEEQEEYVFRHILVRDVAYSQIPRGPRAEKHQRAAAWIEHLGRQEEHAELLAHHYLAALELVRAAAGDVAPLAESARLALRGAGERASRLNAFPAARRYFGTALELWPPEDSERGLVLFGYGQALFDAEARGEDELDEARELLTASGHREEAGVAEVIRAELVWKRGDQRECFRRLERAEQLVAEVPDGRAKTLVLSSLSRFLMLAGQDEEAARVGTRALELAERLGLPDLQSHALNNIGPAKSALGQSEEAIADLERSIAIAAEHNSLEGLRGYVNLASTLCLQGDYRAARDVYERGLALARRFGHRPNIDWLEAEISNIAFMLGDWDRALELGARFVEAAYERSYLAIGRLNDRAVIHIARGQTEAGLAESTRALELARPARDPQALGPALSTQVFALAAAGSTEQARIVAREFLSDTRLAIYATPGPQAWAFAEIGLGDELLQAIAGSTASRLWVDAAAAYLQSDAARAAELYHRIGDLSGEALVRLRWAEELVAQGSRAEADEQLDRSLAFWRSVRATRYVNEGEALLAASA